MICDNHLFASGYTSDRIKINTLSFFFPLILEKLNNFQNHQLFVSSLYSELTWESSWEEGNFSELKGSRMFFSYVTVTQCFLVSWPSLKRCRSWSRVQVSGCSHCLKDSKILYWAINYSNILSNVFRRLLMNTWAAPMCHMLCEYVW